MPEPLDPRRRYQIVRVNWAWNLDSRGHQQGALEHQTEVAFPHRRQGLVMSETAVECSRDVDGLGGYPVGFEGFFEHC